MNQLILLYLFTKKKIYLIITNKSCIGCSLFCVTKLNEFGFTMERKMREMEEKYLARKYSK